jgi:hypothetical protein
VTKAKPRRRWLPHAIGAGSLALLAFLGGAAPEFLSDEFKAKFAPYNKWIVGFIILAAIVEVVCAFVIARRSASEADPPAPANTTTGERNVSIAGSSSGSTIIPGDHNVVAQTVHIHQSVPLAIVPAIAATAPAPALEPTVTPLHQLPAPPHDFIGREQELSDLLDRLGQGVTISGMQGLGGVGKTALALVLAERIKPRYPDAQFYLDLQGASDHPLSTEDAMRHVIRAYHPAARLPESLAELAAIYRSVLHGQRALLLMDNAASRQQVEPLIPPDKNCALLVTSRRQFALPGMHARNLDELPREDSIRLLNSIERASVSTRTRSRSCAATCRWRCAWPARRWPKRATSRQPNMPDGWATSGSVICPTLRLRSTSVTRCSNRSSSSGGARSASFQPASTMRRRGPCGRCRRTRRATPWPA